MYREFKVSVKFSIWGREGVVVMIVWYLDLQLHMPTVTTTTYVESLNTA